MTAYVKCPVCDDTIRYVKFTRHLLTHGSVSGLLVPHVPREKRRVHKVRFDPTAELGVEP